MNLAQALALIASGASEGNWTTEHWVVLSNILLIIVTAVTAILMAREQHRHNEARAKTDTDEKAALTKIIHEVVTAEHEEEMARLAQDSDPKPTPSTEQ